MSNFKERTEKNCLNCNTLVIGKYCHNCGQENIEVKESIWHLLGHFFKDFTHFDSKFLTSLKYLLFKPGHLSIQYINGKRTQFLNPIRMYVFTSFFFFLIFFTLININDNNAFKLTENIETKNKADLDSSIKNNSAIQMIDKKSKYRTKKEYDSLIKLGQIQDNWMERKLKNKQFEVKEKYRDKNETIRVFIEKLIHSLPQIFFVSLPFCALILMILYSRQKKFYYVSHAIFTIHYYIFSFIIMLFMLSLNKLNGYLNWGIIDFTNSILGLSLLIYLYKAMRNFYKQGRGKTIFKLIVLNVLFSIIAAFLFLFFTIFTVLKL